MQVNHHCSGCVLASLLQANVHADLPCRAADDSSVVRTKYAPLVAFCSAEDGISLRLLPWITALALATTTAARCSFYFSFRLCWRRCSRLRSHAVSPCPPFNVAGNFLVEVSKLFCINMRFAALPLNTFVSLLLVLADHGINKFISERQTKSLDVCAS